MQPLDQSEVPEFRSGVRDRDANNFPTVVYDWTSRLALTDYAALKGQPNPGIAVENVRERYVPTAAIHIADCVQWRTRIQRIRTSKTIEIHDILGVLDAGNPSQKYLNF